MADFAAAFTDLDWEIRPAISLESKPGNTVFRISLPFVTKLN